MEKTGFRNENGIKFAPGNHRIPQMHREKQSLEPLILLGWSKK
jgi:hypothetical protein